MTMELPSRVERKVTNRNDETWFEYDGKPLFNDEALDRIRQRFAEMRDSDYESTLSAHGSEITNTKIRTKDKESFIADLQDARKEWIDTHGDRLTSFGDACYGEILTQYRVVEISEEKPRKTVLWAQYDAGQHAGVGGATYKKQQILLPIRDFEQWSYHTEVVEPLFEEYNEKYPY